MPPAQQRHAREEALEQNLRLQGQYLDRETGLHYNTFRYYDPDVGRFISPDPVGLEGGLHLQRYAPNPVSWIDPWGLDDDDLKRMNGQDSGHHAPAVRKAKGRPFEMSRSDKSWPTIFPRGSDPEHDHWRLHNAERKHIGPRKGDFHGTDEELFKAYEKAYCDKALKGMRFI
ncbi:RHS repeat-associated core domain-containing protein [Acidovorax sp. PRC11]|nr:RHS repeat-associated core domain-containing protein [Acidovorax sp. PRC11]MDT0137130.1 RHS repeat-associated core domain-containing protein [Acidovorax sp. PRC11]